MALNFIDLFAGAGGLSEGFIRAGYTPLAHIEMDKYACDTLRTRAAFHHLKAQNQLHIYKKYLQEKQEKEDGSKLWRQVPQEVIDTVIHDTIGEETIENIFQEVDELKGEEQVDIIIGGPPCQAYSVAGRARMGKAVEDDPRNELYLYYVKFLERYQPKIFVFENVLGIRTAKKGEPLKDLTRLVEQAGYKMEVKIQLASEHGVLQNRQRVIIVGWKIHDENGNLTKFHYPELTPEINKHEVLKDLFCDLPERKHGEGQLCSPVKYTKPLSEMEYLIKSEIRNSIFDFTTQHIARPNNENDREIYSMAVEMWLKDRKRIDYSKIPSRLQHHKNKETFLNRFQVVDPYGCCHTVVAHIAMDGHYYIYPTLNPTIDNVRSITVREAARLQSFPDDYYFEGSRSAAFKQIGNAVPVVLAHKIALELQKQFENELQ
ncbi:DNA cytosine methyltransferase [Dysgonomonas sp. Marseille-P4677]|uniref:DNA cytosine methyltransferase n=1 Tax=Dysgonomonas sp. Marseille-P4677 TaxID=2364790 RepID=UPI00191138C5|nr:DNA cytosine methyltransferase [Dysgonomonas sp. Marseille-P4677]MBK5719541.1 DNA cytosine methyltransferase [Dysgonomonas sp. Marseille-P4677]